MIDTKKLNEANYLNSNNVIYEEEIFGLYDHTKRKKNTKTKSA